MTRTLFAATAVALALAGCSKPAPTTSNVIDPMAENVASAPVELPPSIKSSTSYRCKDNSLVYVDLFQGDKQATIRETATGTPTMLRTDVAGEPLKAEGYELVDGGTSLTITRPGHPKQACDA